MSKERGNVNPDIGKYGRNRGSNPLYYLAIYSCTLRSTSERVVPYYQTTRHRIGQASTLNFFISNQAQIPPPSGNIDLDEANPIPIHTDF
jgi:hypothetical protein